MSMERNTPAAATVSPTVAGGIAGSAPAAATPTAAACQGQGAVVLHRGIRGPFDGLIFFTGEKWIFVHCDGAPVVIASSLEELLEEMKKQGFIDAEAGINDLYLEATRLYDPIIPLTSVSPVSLLAFEKGEVELEEVR